MKDKQTYGISNIVKYFVKHMYFRCNLSNQNRKCRSTSNCGSFLGVQKYGGIKHSCYNDNLMCAMCPGWNFILLKFFFKKSIRYMTQLSCMSLQVLDYWPHCQNLCCQFMQIKTNVYFFCISAWLVFVAYSFRSLG